MFKQISRALLPLLVMIVGLLFGAQSAHAQTTWLPDFDAGKHVYLDPALANDPNFPVRFNHLEEELIKRGQKHGLQIYVVATKQGTDASAHSSVPAVAKVNELTLKWQSQPGYPAGDVLVIVWVRFASDPNNGSVAANGGSKLRGYGVDKSDFDADNGPVRPVLPIYLPNDPGGAFLAIADNVNKMVDDYKAEEQRQKEKDASLRALPGKIGLGLLVLAILGGIGFLYVRHSRAKAVAMDRIKKWSEMLDSANAFYIKLHEGYFGFLKEQSDWSTKFNGRTLNEYRAALSDFAEFTLRHQAANKRLDEARKAASGSTFPRIAGFDKSNALLSTEAVVVTGAELPLEMATLFGGLVKKTTYTPDGLLDAMSDLFDRTNKALAGIVKAFREGNQNKQDLEELLTQIHLLQARLGASFDPYQQLLQKIEAAQKELASSAGDPLSTFEKSVSAENEARALVAELERAAKTS
jgi:hypothetical protein